MTLAYPVRSSARVLPWLLALAMLGWWANGVLPIAPVEGDDQGVIFGVQARTGGPAALLPLTYLPEIQPGAYHLLAGLARLTAAPAEVVFASATAAGALAFALLAAALQRLVLGLPFAWALVGVLWCQEIGTAACYLNTSALAAPFALAGVLAVVLPTRLPAVLLSGGLLALAGWIRADSLLVAPACLALAQWRFASWRESLVRTAAAATAATAGWWTLLAASDTGPGALLARYAERGNSGGTIQGTLDSVLALTSPALSLAALGGVALWLQRRRFPELALAAAGALPGVLAYGGSLVTPKYLYYAVPFLLLPSLGLIGVLPRRPFIAGVALLVGVADLFGGLRILRPESRLFPAAPTLLAGPAIVVAGRSLTPVLGAGELIANEDGFRLRTGQGFAPVTWRREKSRLADECDRLRRLLETTPESSAYWSNWFTRQLLFRTLFDAGFAPTGSAAGAAHDPYPGPWRRGDQIVHVAYLGYADDPPLPAPPAGSGAPIVIFLGTGNDSWRIASLPGSRRWERLSPSPLGFLKLHQLR